MVAEDNRNTRQRRESPNTRQNAKRLPHSHRSTAERSPIESPHQKRRDRNRSSQARPLQERAIQQRRSRKNATYVKQRRRPQQFSTRRLIISIGIEALFVVALYLRFDDIPTIIEKAALGCVLLWLSNTDLLSRKIPNASILVALAIRIAYMAYVLNLYKEPLGMIWNSLIGCAVIGVFAFAISYISEHLSGRAGLGGGDVKLLAIAGLYFGLEGGVLILFIACIAALAGYVIRRTDDGTFPFAPAISLACAIVALI